MKSNEKHQLSTVRQYKASTDAGDSNENGTEKAIGSRD